MFASLNKPLRNSIVLASDIVELEGESSVSASLDLKLNGTSVKTASGTTISHSLSGLTAGNYEVILEATDGSITASDTSFFVVNPSISTANVPSGMELGINYTSASSATLVLLAPFKDYVYVLGDFNDWKVNTNYFMNRDPDGRRYWLELQNLDANSQQAFQYFVDGDIKIADPYSELILDPSNDQWISSTTFPDIHPYPVGKTSGIATLMDLDLSLIHI